MEMKKILVEEGYIVRSNDWVSKAKSLYSVQQQIRELEKLESKLTDEFKQLSECKLSCGGGFKFFSVTRRGSIDYKSIPQLKKIDLEKYRKSDVVCWKLSYIGK